MPAKFLDEKKLEIKFFISYDTKDNSLKILFLTPH